MVIGGMMDLMLLAAHAQGFWTGTHTLILLNAILAAAALITALVGLLTIRASNRVAEATEKSAASASESTRVAGEQVVLGQKQIDLGQRQLDQDLRALAASVQPLVTDVPLDQYRQPEVRQLGHHDLGAIVVNQINDSLEILVPIRNIGSGPAFIRVGSIGGAVGMDVPAIFDREVIAAGELAFAAANVSQEHISYANLQLLTTEGTWRLIVQYGDLSGDRKFQSELKIRSQPEKPYYIRQVRIRSLDSEWRTTTAPDIVSGPSE
jgi:hypothetical protein